MGCLTRLVQGWVIGKAIQWFRNRKNTSNTV
jgi:hypothetical protein